MARIHPLKLAETLQGKTVARIEHGNYLHWDMTISEIHFTDGSYIELCGNADEARIEFYYSPDGEQFKPKMIGHQ